MEDVKITVRLDPDLHQRLADAAKVDRRSLNSEIAHLLSLALDARD